ncbi:MAG TPA: alpha/beta hydrolase [Chloroflexia bacterium]|jgi:pimeloyl-ACP methyl ester carboxylesterase|nr:alpha/beta hydrolase [Chloroflexia bacterium]
MPFVRAGDLNVHYIEQGAGTPIVFVHGNWVTSTTWEPVLDRLPPGYHGIAPDVRGRGKTEGPDSDYSIPSLAADLHAFVDALGLDRFHLVGHSLGTAIAMQFALDHPERVRTLTVVAPAWVDGMPEAFNNPAGQEALKANKALFGQALKALVPAAPADAYWQRVVDEGHEQRLEASLRNVQACLDWKPGDRVGEAGIPTLVVDGAQDILTGGPNVDRAAAALKARKTVVLPDIGHSPNMEAPDTFVALLIEHIKEFENG